MNVNKALSKLILSRGEFGEAKYNKELIPFDNRNTVMDCLEELLDASVYLLKLIEERKQCAECMSIAAVACDRLGEYDLSKEFYDMSLKLSSDVERIAYIDG